MAWEPYAKRHEPPTPIKAEKEEESFFPPPEPGKEENMLDYNVEELKEHIRSLEFWENGIARGRDPIEDKPKVEKLLRAARKRMKGLTKHTSN